MRKWTVVVALLLVVFISCNLIAQTKRICGVDILTTPSLDGWSVTHFATGILFQKGFVWAGLKPEHALTSSIFMGYAREIVIDGYGVDFIYDHDPRGADIFGDAFFIALGAYVEYRLQKISERVIVQVGKKRVSLTLDLNKRRK